MDPTPEGRSATPHDRLLRATGKTLRGVGVPLLALLIFAVMALVAVFVLSALVMLTEFE